MNWYIVDKKYINYLTQFDSHVGYVEYGERLPCRKMLRFQNVRRKVPFLFTYLTHQSVTFL